MGLLENRRDYLELLVSIAVPNLVGLTSGFLSAGTQSFFQELAKPPLTPPSLVFPVAWTILYTLMGISFFLAYKSNVSRKGVIYFALQLLINGAWSIVFFRFGSLLAGFLVITALFVTVALTFNEFYKANRRAAYILIPYMAWILFAAYLNLGIVFLN